MWKSNPFAWTTGVSLLYETTCSSDNRTLIRHEANPSSIKNITRYSKAKQNENRDYIYWNRHLFCWDFQWMAHANREKRMQKVVQSFQLAARRSSSMIARSTLFDAENVFRSLSVRVPRSMEENVLQKNHVGFSRTDSKNDMFAFRRRYVSLQNMIANHAICRKRGFIPKHSQPGMRGPIRFRMLDS